MNALNSALELLQVFSRVSASELRPVGIERDTEQVGSEIVKKSVHVYLAVCTALEFKRVVVVEELLTVSLEGLCYGGKVGNELGVKLLA